jgi:hypothetical protein
LVDQTLSHLTYSAIRPRQTPAFTAALLRGLALALLLSVATPVTILSAQADEVLAEAAADQSQATAASGSFRSIRMKEAPNVSQRAWESRPYQVAVWICHRGQPQLVAVESKLFAKIETFCELLDASSWFVNAGTPPPHWRNMLYSNFEATEGFTGFETDPELQFYDKLMIVKLDQQGSLTHAAVREVDLQTGQWGPVVDNTISSINHLGSVIGRSVADAFMPLAKIDRVDEKNKVHIRARALEACIRVSFASDMVAEIEPITSSPVYVRDDDRLLPIIRRTDRSGDLVSLDPIPFTFLTLDSINGSSMVASIESSQRNPLGQRKSKRSQKLAIVIRPVERSTVLHLESRPAANQTPSPLEGYEVWARRPGDTKDIESEFIGKTDWQGNATIPPSDSGLRLLYIKRGSRALRKLPVIPGFKDRLVSQLPNDDARLFAEGVINGYSNDIINLVVQRELLEVDIESALNDDRLEEARIRMREYQDLETPADLKIRMSNEEIRLKSMTSDDREFEFISKMFSNLRQVLNSKVTDSRATELQQRLQERTRAKGADG